MNDGEPVHAPGSQVSGPRSTGTGPTALRTGGDVGRAATGGDSLPSMNARISGAADVGEPVGLTHRAFLGTEVHDPDLHGRAALCQRSAAVSLAGRGVRRLRAQQHGGVDPDRVPAGVAADRGQRRRVELAVRFRAFRAVLLAIAADRQRGPRHRGGAGRHQRDGLGVPGRRQFERFGEFQHCNVIVDVRQDRVVGVGAEAFYFSSLGGVGRDRDSQAQQHFGGARDDKHVARRIRGGGALVVDAVRSREDVARVEDRAAAAENRAFRFEQHEDLPGKLRDRRFLPADDVRSQRRAVLERGAGRGRGERLLRRGR